MPGQFSPLAPVLEGGFWFDSALADLPADVRARIRRDFPLLEMWDSLAPGHRRRVAEQRDCSRDPANAEAAQIGWDQEQAGWAHWGKVRLLTAQEFCVLCRGHDPRTFDKDRRTTYEKKPLGECVRDDMKILQRGGVRAAAKRTLTDWIAQAHRFDVTVPAFLRPRASAAPVVRPEIFSIHCIGRNCRLEYRGAQVHRKATTGLQYIELLAKAPGKPVSAEVLHATVNPAHPDAPDARSSRDRRQYSSTQDLDEDEGAAHQRGTNRETVMSRDALAKAKHKLVKLEESRAIAIDQKYDARAAELSSRIHELTRYIGGAQNHRGEPRPVLSDRERIDRAVGAAIRRAVKAIRIQHPQLGEHLYASLRCGSSCCYSAR